MASVNEGIYIFFSIITSVPRDSLLVFLFVALLTLLSPGVVYKYISTLSFLPSEGYSLNMIQLQNTVLIVQVLAFIELLLVNSFELDKITI